MDTLYTIMSCSYTTVT